MDPLTIILLAVGLAMDALAVSLCKGLAIGRVRLPQALLVGLWFGVFQALMPIIGFFLGQAFYDIISDYTHWVAFILLLLIGANMIKEALSDEEEELDSGLGVKIMFLLAVATSIDALAVGISLAMETGEILIPATAIGVITMAISMAGVYVGGIIGDRFGHKAEILGGTILILIGTKFLLDGLGIL